MVTRFLESIRNSKQPPKLIGSAYVTTNPIRYLTTKGLYCFISRQRKWSSHMHRLPTWTSRFSAFEWHFVSHALILDVWKLQKWCTQSHFRVNLLLSLFLALPRDFLAFLSSIDSTVSCRKLESESYYMKNVKPETQVSAPCDKKWKQNYHTFVYNDRHMKIARTA